MTHAQQNHATAQESSKASAEKAAIAVMLFLLLPFSVVTISLTLLMVVFLFIIFLVSPNLMMMTGITLIVTALLLGTSVVSFAYAFLAYQKNGLVNNFPKFMAASLISMMASAFVCAFMVYQIVK